MGDRPQARRRTRLSAAAAALCVAALLIAGPLAGSSPASPLSPVKWAPTVRADADPPYASRTAINGVSCPSASFCAAVDIQGDVLTSTDPTGGSGAWSRAVVQQGDDGLRGVSCASSRFCVAFGGGSLFVSTEPAGGPGAWSKAKVETNLERKIVSVFCRSAQFCIAGDNRGNVAVSTDPTGGEEAWKLVHIDGDHERWIEGISCPSATLCVAVSEEGALITSTEPTGGERAWKIARIADGSRDITDVSCTSESFCLATDNLAEVFTSTNPTGGAAAWSAVTVDGTGGDYISCPAASFCILAGGGAVFTSTEPAGGPGAWTRTPINLPNEFGGEYSIQDISCASASLCVLTDSGSQVITATEPAGGESAWTVTNLEVGVNFLGSISCASRRLCVGVDNAGNAVSSTDPVGARRPWSSVHIDDHRIGSVSCPSEQFCAAADEAGNVLTSSEPAGGAGAWSSADVDGTNRIESISCPSAGLCVATDRNGNVLSSTEPAGGAGTWQVVSVAAYNSLTNISCPSAQLCVAIDDETPLVSTNPTGGAAAWARSFFYLGHSVSCPSAQLCVGVQFPERNVVFSPDPAGEVWGQTNVEEVNGIRINGLDEVGCAAGWLCVISTYSYSSKGDVLISADPTGGAEAWVEDNAYGKPTVPPEDGIISFYILTLTGTSCVSEEMCALVDYEGRAMVATPAVGPANLEAPHLAGTAFRQSWPTLSCTPGSWSGEPAPELHYRWLRDEEPIAGAEAAAYTVHQADAGHALSCEVTAINGGGSASATSNALQVPPQPVNTGAPSLTGTPAVGQSLDCSQGAWENAPTSYAYAWLSDGRPIASTAAGTYTVQKADAGHALSCKVTATNGGGSTSAVSNALLVPSASPPGSTNPPPPNDFEILRVRGGRQGRILLELAVPGPGSARARATIARAELRTLDRARARSRGRAGARCGQSGHPGRRVTYGAATAAASGSGAVQLVVRPQGGILAHLRRSGTACATVAVEYAPDGGMPRTETAAVAIRLKPTR